MNGNYGYNSLKTTLIGASTTGKTSLVTRIKNNAFIDRLECTIGVSFTRLTHEGMNYELWDTAGQERFHSLLPMYFRGTRILIFVFDLSTESTFFIIEKYFKDLQAISNYKIIVVGNKLDLVNENDIKNIDYMIRDKIKKSIIADKVFDYVYISAKTGVNCDLLLDVMNKCSETITIPTREPRALTLPINPDKTIESKQCSC